MYVKRLALLHLHVQKCHDSSVRHVTGLHYTLYLICYRAVLRSLLRHLFQATLHKVTYVAALFKRLLK